MFNILGIKKYIHENHWLVFKYRQLKNSGKIHSSWFWNNEINVKLSERSNPVKLYHNTDIGKRLGFDNLDEFISNI